MDPRTEPITSVRNARVVEARKLTQRKHRARQDRFLVEGLQLLGMAVEAAQKRDGIHPRNLFYCSELFAGEMAPRLLQSLIGLGAEATPVVPHVLDTLSEREVSQGLACTFEASTLERDVDELTIPTDGPSLLVVLDRLQDPGNLGTLIRTADAVGARGVVLVEPCVDPFDPKTVRGTMGSLFSVPFARASDPTSLFEILESAGHRVVGADGSADETVWASDVLCGPVALVLGNEARGLSDDVRGRLTDSVSLPLLGGAESLNVAVAGAVLMYEWLRVNRHSAPDTGRPASPPE